MYEHLKALLDAPETSSELKAEILEVLLSKDNPIRDLVDTLLGIARQNKIQVDEAEIDSKIFEWFPNAIVSTNPFPEGNWKQVDGKNGTTEKEMLKTSQKMVLSQAIKCFIQALKDNFFLRTNAYRIIFLEEKNLQKKSVGLVCGRNSKGDLKLYISIVTSKRLWNFSNDSWYTKTNV